MSDKVGYCNPPKLTQFKSGKSGNPKGRPKGSCKGFKKLLEAELNKKVILSDGSKLSKQEVLATQLVNDAIQGKDFKKTKYLMEFTKKLEVAQLSELFV